MVGVAGIGIREDGVVIDDCASGLKDFGSGLIGRVNFVYLFNLDLVDEWDDVESDFPGLAHNEVFVFLFIVEVLVETAAIEGSDHLVELLQIHPWKERKSYAIQVNCTLRALIQPDVVESRTPVIFGLLKLEKVHEIGEHAHWELGYVVDLEYGVD